jgi:hypothetical protein
LCIKKLARPIAFVRMILLERSPRRRPWTGKETHTHTISILLCNAVKGRAASPKGPRLGPRRRPPQRATRPPLRPSARELRPSHLLFLTGASNDKTNKRKVAEGVGLCHLSTRGALRRLNCYDFSATAEVPL